MAKEICISSTPHETRLAILEDDQLAEIYYERENEYTLAGSIYNGRVTRVLPGMQSAFVDIGLERDAFLYVTDFMELEDPEETDEVEKAAATGATQRPREVRHANPPEKAAPRTEERAPKPEQKQEPRSERPSRDRRPSVEIVPDEAEVAEAAPVYASVVEQEEKNLEEGEPGARRWRGRRRRRSGRGGQAEAPQQTQQPTQEPVETYSEPEFEEEPETAPEIYAAAIPAAVPAPTPVSEPSPRSERAPAPFVLPGESLSKYGGVTEDETPVAAPAAPARPASTFKPSTMIEVPLVWDGSGLLPGESLSKHRSSEPAVEASPEPKDTVSDASHEEFEETEELVPESGEDHLVEESEVPAPAKTEDYEIEPAIDEPSAEEPVAAAVTRQDETVVEPVPAQPEPDAAASHNVDPLPPTGFRLFGMGGKKKGDETPAKPAAKPSASNYAPGSGPIEEEILEEEEFEAAPRHHKGKAEDHDFDFEEETLPTQVRSGEFGEMFQEAHLDHRIGLNDKNGDEDGFDEEGDEEPATGVQPVSSEAQNQRRDRGGRGRRGRGGQTIPAAPTANRRGGPSRRSMQTSDLPIISDLLKPGQEILVQIAKEPIALKGARITSHIALPGRFLVFMPTVTHVGVSRKIASDEERNRLKRILVSERGDAQGGFIVRTAAEGASEEDLRADLRFLIHLWNEIKQRSDSSKSPALIYHDLSLIERILRDQVSSNFTNIWVDSEANYERIVRFLNHFSPTLTRRVKLYTKETPLFEHFGIQDEISKALRSKVWLKSGGSIVINQTEALVAIDINTGKYVGKSARLEDTIVKTNLDAVPEIVRQIRLRDLGGIIVIDFIDMDDRKNRFKVMAALEEALKSDRAPTKVLQFNDFGLVAITRKRVKQSLERTLSVPCPTCQATGMVKSPTTVCNEIYTELRKMKKHFEGEDVLLRVNPETVKVLKANNASWITEFEELVGKNILIKSDPALHPEQFDIQG
jgi:ribonuclease G